MRTRIARALVVALLVGSMLIVGTAHAGFGQPGGDRPALLLDGR
jgi:hypothetical protein